MSLSRYVSPRFLLVTACILAAAVGGFYLARALARPQIVEVPLPPRTVRVTEVREIQTPGPTRVVERIKWQTQAVEVPRETVRTIVQQGETGPPPQARVRVEAEQYQGVEAGQTVRGWSGWATCDLKLGERWQELARSPIDLNESEAVSVPIAVPPPPLNMLEAGVAFTGEGLGYVAGYARRLTWRTRAGRAVLPDWIGGQLLILPDTTAVTATVRWEF